MSKKLMDQFNLSGRTALVTGGGSGMGKEFARILAEAGATVMIAARNEERLKSVAAEIAMDTGAKVYYRYVNLEQRDEADALIQHAQKVMGGLDILVGNAAIDLIATAEHFNAEDYDRVFAVNLTSNIWMTRAAVPAMKKNKWGRIIFISSISSGMGLRNLPIGIYASSKAALESYARYLAAELGTEGITANCIVPGGVKSEMQAASTAASVADHEQVDEKVNYLSSLIPTNRFAMPAELAGTLLLLASNAGSYINGARYVVDGGWTSFGDNVREI